MRKDTGREREMAGKKLIARVRKRAEETKGM